MRHTEALLENFAKPSICQCFACCWGSFEFPKAKGKSPLSLPHAAAATTSTTATTLPQGRLSSCLSVCRARTRTLYWQRTSFQSRWPLHVWYLYSWYPMGKGLVWAFSFPHSLRFESYILFYIDSLLTLSPIERYKDAIWKVFSCRVPPNLEYRHTRLKWHP